MLTVTAMVFAVGMSGIVMGLPSIPQVEAEGTDYGKCNQTVNNFEHFFGRAGKEMADHRKEFCTSEKP